MAPNGRKLQQSLEHLLSPMNRLINTVRTRRAYFHLFHKTKDVFYKTDTNDIIVFGNPALAKTFGYDSVQEILGTDVKDLWVKPEGREAFKELLRKQGSITDYIVHLKRRDGSDFYASVDSQILRNRKGEEVGIEAIGRDVSERIKLEDTLKESEQKYRTLVDSSLDGIFVIQDGKVKFANAAFQKIFGCTEEQLKEMGQDAMISPKFRPQVRKGYEDIFSGRKEYCVYEVKGAKSNGQEIDINLKSRISHFDGRPAIINYVKDLTKERELTGKLIAYDKELQEAHEHLDERTRDLEEREKALRIAYEQQEELIRARDKFIQDLSHEIRQPISNILMISYNAKRIGTQVRLMQSVNEIVEQLKRLDRLAFKFWVVEQAGSGKLIWNPSQINVYHKIVEAVDLMRALAAAKHIRIKINELIARWPLLWIDEDLFMHVVLNLIDNAIKYSFRSTEIHIFGTNKPSSVSLTIRNEGIVIDPEERDEIFERGFRTNEAVSMLPSGSGIGLYLVKLFIDHIGGKVNIESKPTHDIYRYKNTFTLEIPKQRL